MAVLGFMLAAAWGTPVSAQTPPPPLPQEQFDALVKAITSSVLEKLKAEKAAPAPAPTHKTGRYDADAARSPDDISLFISRAGEVLKHGLPALGEAIAGFGAALDNTPRGGRSDATFALLMAGTIAAALALELLLRRLTWPAHLRLAATAAPSYGRQSLASLAGLALLDGAGVLLVWAVCRIAAHLWLGGPTVQDAFGAALLLTLFYWRLYVFGFRVGVRPALPSARLCEMRDDEAVRMMRLLSAVVLIALSLRLAYLGLHAAGATIDAIAAGRVIGAPIALAVLMLFVVWTRESAARWLNGLARVAPWNGFIARHWVPVASTIFVALFGTQIYGAITERLNAPTALMLTLNLLIGLLAFETLLQAAVLRLDGPIEGATPAATRLRLPDVLARCARVFTLIVVVVFIAESWVVNVLGLVDERAWDRLAQVGRSTGITLFSAFVLWELFKYATESYMWRLTRRNLEAGGTGRFAGSAVARFDTLMPMIRVTVGTVIAIIAVLVALDDLGVNTAPLLAGASVLGLAISFGSQALVKDIVSGIFYLADDAFRVGEYIRCGNAEGTVEGFTLRSIRLRHRDGLLQVIPFGDLGQIGNFSRDWTAIKFNLRFARDTDLEKLREATKAVGAELMAEPDLATEILEPLRIHSVAEVADNALVVRFKLKTLPANSGTIQDRALQQMLKSMPKHGIGFAS